MKKVMIFVLCMCMLLALSACGGGGSTNLVVTKPLAVAQENTVEDYADFTLFKVATSKKITASLAGTLYFENDKEGETYIDIVLDWTNKSTEGINSADLLEAFAIGANGTEYKRCLYAVETNNASYLSQYEHIAPLSTARLHCAISVPESEKELTLMLKINGEVYACKYNLGQKVSSAQQIQPGQTVGDTDFATMEFLGIEYTDDLLPSNTSGAYSHYPVKNATNTYLVVKFDITSYLPSAKDCDAFVGVKATYMDKYTYTGFVVVESDDGKRFSSYDDIDPLTTRHFYCLIEVPKTVTENEVELTISFGNQEFVFTGSK